MPANASTRRSSASAWASRRCSPSRRTAIDGTALRRELDALRDETNALLKRRVRKTEKRLNKRIDKIDARTEALEQRLDQAEQDRKYAEWRIHTNTEQMLDSLLREVRAIADLLTAGGRAGRPLCGTRAATSTQPEAWWLTSSAEGAPGSFQAIRARCAPARENGISRRS